jgi:hypothetical protein
LYSRRKCLSLKYIKKYYDVPADKGVPVIYDGKECTIIGTDGPHLKIQFNDSKITITVHPTWKVKYIHHSSKQ